MAEAMEVVSRWRKGQSSRAGYKDRGQDDQSMAFCPWGLQRLWLSFKTWRVDKRCQIVFIVIRSARFFFQWVEEFHAGIKMQQAAIIDAVERSCKRENRIHTFFCFQFSAKKPGFPFFFFCTRCGHDASLWIQKYIDLTHGHVISHVHCVSHAAVSTVRDLIMVHRLLTCNDGCSSEMNLANLDRKYGYFAVCLHSAMLL